MLVYTKSECEPNLVELDLWYYMEEWEKGAEVCVGGRRIIFESRYCPRVQEEQNKKETEGKRAQSLDQKKRNKR